MTKLFGVIYLASNTETSKCYVGQTVQKLSSRISEHISRASKGTTKSYFANSLNKYDSEIFTWEILEYCDSKEELDEMEFHYIKQYNSIYPYGYNLTLGGEGTVGYKHSEETIAKMLRGRKYTKLSKEAIEHRSEKQSYDWEITKPNGERIVVRNLQLFCANNNLHSNSMYRVSRGERKHHKGHSCIRLSKSSKVCSSSTKKLISKANKGRKFTRKSLSKIIKANSKTWLVTTPLGVEITVLNLKKFCES